MSAPVAAAGELAQIEQSGAYSQPTQHGYEQALLDLVDRGRDQAGLTPRPPAELTT